MTDQISPASQELFNLIVENVKDYAIFAVNAEGCVVSWNPGVERLLGYDEAEIVGQSIAVIFTPEDREGGAHLREMETAAREGRAEDQRWHVRKDGTRFWGNGLVVPLRDGGGLRGFAKVMRDDTERKRLEDERAELLARAEDGQRQAEEANRVKDVFLATLSHELRTPLTAILGWTRLLRGGQLDETASARALETVERNAKAQLQLIEDMLDISRVIAGKLRLNRRTTELTEAINAAIDTMRPAAAAKHITVEAGLDASASLVSGDADRLQQVMTNLLSNAVKFTPEGGRVTVRLARADSRARITVSDTGKGIEADVLPEIFDLFKQADSSATRRHGGLGIGLALVQHIVELHKGTVVAESEGEGHGATFTVDLPPLAVRRKPNDKETAAAMTADELPVDFRPLLRGLRLLLVEDEEDAHVLIGSMLEHYGAQVASVTSAGAALEWLAGAKPDVIISDVGLPDEDGLSFMRKVRAREAETEGGGRTPSVALTAYAGTEDRTRALLAGFQVHVAKPVEPMELAAVVASLAGRTGTI